MHGSVVAVVVVVVAVFVAASKNPVFPTDRQALVHGRRWSEPDDRSSALAIGERGCLGVADKSQQ